MNITIYSLMLSNLLNFLFFFNQPNYTQIAEACNIWRNYRDIQDSWDIVADIIEFYGNDSDHFSSVAHPGAFNDPDMVCKIELLILLSDYNAPHYNLF